MANYFNELIEISKRFNKKINSYCEILIQEFNLSHFWYYKLTNRGEHSYIGNNIEWGEYFFSQGLFLKSPYLHHPDNYKSGISMMKDLQDLNHLDTMKSAKEKFSVYCSLKLMNKIPGGIEGFGFAVHSPKEWNHMKLINSIPLLRLFSERFRIDHPTIFRLIDEKAVNVASLIGPEFYRKDIHVSAEPVNALAFLKKMGLEVGERPTHTEMKVLKYFMQGYSASQIGHQLFRSKRTIEHHLENIKDKLRCQSKAELVQKVQKLESLGYFF